MPSKAIQWPDVISFGSPVNTPDRSTLLNSDEAVAYMNGTSFEQVDIYYYNATIEIAKSQNSDDQEVEDVVSLNKNGIVLCLSTMANRLTIAKEWLMSKGVDATRLEGLHQCIGKAIQSCFEKQDWDSFLEGLDKHLQPLEGLGNEEAIPEAFLEALGIRLVRGLIENIEWMKELHGSDELEGIEPKEPKPKEVLYFYNNNETFVQVACQVVAADSQDLQRHLNGFLSHLREFMPDSKAVGLCLDFLVPGRKPDPAMGLDEVASLVATTTSPALNVFTETAKRRLAEYLGLPTKDVDNHRTFTPIFGENVMPKVCTNPEPLFWEAVVSRTFQDASKSLIDKSLSVYVNKFQDSVSTQDNVLLGTVQCVRSNGFNNIFLARVLADIKNIGSISPETRQMVAMAEAFTVAPMPERFKLDGYDQGRAFEVQYKWQKGEVIKEATYMLFTHLHDPDKKLLVLVAGTNNNCTVELDKGSLTVTFPHKDGGRDFHSQLDFGLTNYALTGSFQEVVEKFAETLAKGDSDDVFKRRLLECKPAEGGELARIIDAVIEVIDGKTQDLPSVQVSIQTFFEGLQTQEATGTQGKRGQQGKKGKQGEK